MTISTLKPDTFTHTQTTVYLLTHLHTHSYHRAAKDPQIAGRSNEGGLGAEEHEATKKKVARPIRFDQGAERHSGNDRNR